MYNSGTGKHYTKAEIEHNIDQVHEMKIFINDMNVVVRTINKVICMVYDCPSNYDTPTTDEHFDIYGGMVYHSVYGGFMGEERFTKKFPVALLLSDNVHEDATKWAIEFYADDIAMAEEYEKKRLEERKRIDINRLHELRKMYPYEI